MNNNSSFLTGTNVVVKKVKGKLYKGSIYTPSSKCNFGSIPAKNEQILFHDNLLKKSKSLPTFVRGKTKSIPISKQGTVIQYYVDQPANKVIFNNTSFKKQSTIDPNIYKKKVLNRSFGTSQRFVEDTNTYLNRFYPGPSDYQKDVINRDFYHSSNVFKYTSLFKQNSSQFLFDKTNHLGPGCYYRDKSNDAYKIPIIFKREKKFFNLKDKIREKSGEISGPGLFDIKSCFDLSDRKRPNYYFMQHSDINVNYEDKYNKYEKERHIAEKQRIYDLKKRRIRQNYNTFFKDEVYKYQKQYLNQHKEIKKNRSKKEIEVQRFRDMLKFQMEIYANTREQIKLKKGFASISTKKGIDYKNNHVPGPCYYDYNKILYFLNTKKHHHNKKNGVWEI